MGVAPCYPGCLRVRLASGLRDIHAVGVAALWFYAVVLFGLVDEGVVNCAGLGGLGRVCGAPAAPVGLVDV